MADLNTSNNKASSLLYLREDRIKISLNNFFEANRIFEKEIFNNLDDEQLGMADIRCLLIINLNPGIIFNELLNILDIRKQSLNRVLRSLLKKKFIIIGSAHNIKEIRNKEIQNVDKIFISSLFKKNKNYLGMNRFKLISNYTKKEVVVLGGISKKNIKKLRLINITEFAGIAFFE